MDACCDRQTILYKGSFFFNGRIKLDTTGQPGVRSTFFPSGLCNFLLHQKNSSQSVISNSTTESSVLQQALHQEGSVLEAIKNKELLFSKGRCFSLVTQPETLAPVVSSTTLLIFRSSSHASRWDTKARHSSSPVWQPAVQELRCGQKIPSSQIHRVFEH